MYAIRFNYQYGQNGLYGLYIQFKYYAQALQYITTLRITINAELKSRHLLYEKSGVNPLLIGHRA